MLSLLSQERPQAYNFFENGSYFNDGTVAIAVAMLLFMIPSKNKNGGSRILEGDAVTRLPWGIVLLFGGGPPPPRPKNRRTRLCAGSTAFSLQVG
jgi:sodium-dependent dicarboxylate transporter 2/3/5